MILIPISTKVRWHSRTPRIITKVVWAHIACILHMVLQIFPPIRSLCRIYVILSIWLLRFLVVFWSSATLRPILILISTAIEIIFILFNRILVLSFYGCGLQFFDLKTRHLSYGWDLNRCAYSDKSLWSINLTAWYLLFSIWVNVVEIVISLVILVWFHRLIQILQLNPLLVLFRTPHFLHFFLSLPTFVIPART